MKIPYELQIGWRYTCVGKRTTGNGFISFIALLSMIGVALGVAVLIIVLSVMNGFQRDVRDKMLSVFPHVEFFSILGPSAGLKDWNKEAQKALSNSHVIGAAPYFEAQALLSCEDSVRGVMLRGIDPHLEVQVSSLAPNVMDKLFEYLLPGNFKIIIAGILADNMGISVGDKVTVVAPREQSTPAGIIPRMKKFTVAGIFRSGHFEFDSNLVFMNIEDAQIFYRRTSPSGVRLKLADINLAPRITNELRSVLSKDVFVTDWTKQNSNWFAAMQVEKRMMFIILTLLIAVAAFNLVSSLVMTVMDKQADIAILRTLGAQSKSIMLIFFTQGIAIGIIGIFMGMLCGVLIALNIPVIVPTVERLLGVHFLPKGVYFIDELPSQLLWSDVSKVASMAFLFCMLATLYPSFRATQIKPAKALRYKC